MKKVLLLYPELPPFGFWNYKEVCRLLGAKFPAAPLGMITLAALLPQEWDMRLIDLNTTRLDDSAIDWADLVFLGGMLPQQINLLKLIDRVHARGKKVVVGGPDPTSQPKTYQKADYLVLGEAEATIYPFLADLEKGVQSGIYTSEHKPDIKKSPVPRFDLLNLKDYLMIGIQFCRGCPFNCEFCDIIELFGRIPRTKTPEQVIKELETLYQLGYRGHIDFVDDNFIGHRSKVKELLIMLKDWSKRHNFPFFYSTEASVNLADDEELLGLMRDLDFRYLFVGIESPDPKILKFAQKGQNIDRRLIEDLSKIYQYGMIVNAGFILGFDNEDTHSAKLITDIVQDSKIVMAMVGLLYALPNTQLTRRLKKETRLLKNINPTDEKSQALLVDQSSSGLNFVTRRPRTEIMRDFLFIINTVYSDKNYFDRCLELGRVLQTNYRYQPSLKRILNSVKAFIKLVAKLGFRKSAAFYFWRNIFCLLFSNPKALEAMVNLMAMFIHFSKETKFITNIMNEKIRKIEEIGEANFYKELLDNPR